MMKVLAASVLALASFSAFAETTADISCKSVEGSSYTMSFSALNLYVSEDEKNIGSMENVKASMKRDYDGKIETGRARTLEVDANYRPTKYKNSVRFNLSNMIDTKDFGRFMPNDTCVINVIMPQNIMAKDEIEIPAVINCDQSGGTITLACELTNKEEH